MYHIFHETNKILNAIITNSVDTLHPNLKTKAKKIIKQIDESKFSIENLPVKLSNQKVMTRKTQ